MIKSPQRSFPRLFAITSVIALVLAQILLPVSQVNAAQITDRKLTLGNSVASNSQQTVAPAAVQTTYAFSFDLPGSGTIQSMSFTACTTASGTCTTPNFFTITGSTLTGAPTNLGTGGTWTANTATAGSLRITNASSATGPSAGLSTVSFSNVTNPDVINTVFFLRIVSYSDAAWTTPIDSGVVAASTTRGIELDGYMPESLIFCTAEAITMVGVVPDCTTATDGAVSFDQEFSPAFTRIAMSQMAASTNAGFGYVITVNGPTLTSGANTIPPMTSPTGSTVGIGQFGINLVNNTGTPPGPIVGGAITPISNGTNYQANPATDYASDGVYKFITSGDIVARSDDAVALSPSPTDSQRYTVSYIANVSGSQPAGSYVTTLIYICTPTF